METLKYFFIDDGLVTGIAAQGITSHYDWSKSFLEAHTDCAEILLRPERSFYTPEMLTAIDLNISSIFHLYQNARKCHYNPNCYKILQKLPIHGMKPEKVTNIYGPQSEQ